MHIPGINSFDGDVLMLISPTTTKYHQWVLIQVGSHVIGQVTSCISEKELQSLSQSWKTAYVSTIISRAIFISDPDFNLDQVKGSVVISEEVTIPAMQITVVKGLTTIMGHHKSVHVFVESSPKCTTVFILGNTSELKAGNSHIEVVVVNKFGRDVKLKPGTEIGTVTATNIVPTMQVSNDSEVTGPERMSSMLAQVGSIDVLRDTSDMVRTDLKDILQKLNLSGMKDWEPSLLKAVRDLIHEFPCIFSQDDLDLSKTSIVKHSIKVNNFVPFKEWYRHIPPGMYEEVKVDIQEMLDVGAIRPSNSPWASAVVLVWKKDGKLQFHINLWNLNARTIKDTYSIPRIDEILDCLNGAEWFPSLDLKSEYWQVEMEEDSKALTAFTVGPLGFYDCECMPFGLTKAPATFQWLMQRCLGNLHLHYCIIYLDDVIVFSKTPKEHVVRLRAVFDRLKQAGLKLKPSKCEFFRQELTYLGHVMSKDGTQTNPKNVEAICKWPIPSNMTKVRSFLWSTNYYQWSIRKYAQVAEPLYKLILGEHASRKCNPIQWDLGCQTAYVQMKELCTTTPILAYRDFTKPFKLHTNASVLGLGAVLYQVHEGIEKVISYASRSLTQSETKYPDHKLEFLFLKWAITEQFYDYLYGNTF